MTASARPACAAATVRFRQLANDLGMHRTILTAKKPETSGWNMDFPLIRDNAKCIKCMRCIQICDKVQGLGVWDVIGTGSRTTVNVADERSDSQEADCALCGQCITHCPVGALRERDDTDKVLRRARTIRRRSRWCRLRPLCARHGASNSACRREDATVKQAGRRSATAWAWTMFLTRISALILTIMEEGSGVHRAACRTGQARRCRCSPPAAPAGCVSLRRSIRILLEQLSTAKSPQQMFGAITKTYFAEKTGHRSGEDLLRVHHALRGEEGRVHMAGHGQTRAQGRTWIYVLTTRELARMIRAEPSIRAPCRRANSIRRWAEYTGAGVIFGATGGVMEAALRTAYLPGDGQKPRPGCVPRGARHERAWKEADV